ncbi:MAG: transporter substrate-binding domain-containing protein [Anaerocolumna sp.]
MKKYTRLFAVLVVFIMLLAGCGSKETQDTGAEATGGTDSTVTQDSSSESIETGNGEVSETLKRLMEQGYITIASSNDAPLSYIDVETNQYTGVDGEIFKDLMNRLGVPEVRMKTVAFENLLIELNNKSVDMVVDAMYIKPERKEIALFTNVWYSEGDCLLVKSDSDIKSLADLKDKTVDAQKGTAFLEIAQNWEAQGLIKKLTIMGSQSELMLSVNTGKVDACITDSIIAGYTLTQDSSLDLKLAEDYTADSKGNIGAALRFEDKDFCAEVNAVLDEMKEDGSLMKYLEQYGMNDSSFVGVEEGKTVQ